MVNKVLLSGRERAELRTGMEISFLSHTIPDQTFAPRTKGDHCSVGITSGASDS